MTWPKIGKIYRCRRNATHMRMICGERHGVTKPAGSFIMVISVKSEVLVGSPPGATGKRIAFLYGNDSQNALHSTFFYKSVDWCAFYELVCQ